MSEFVAVLLEAAEATPCVEVALEEWECPPSSVSGCGRSSAAPAVRPPAPSFGGRNFCATDGRYLDKAGYWRLADGRREHTVRAEILLGRKLYWFEIVHHIDGSRCNDLSNLAVLTRREHVLLHNKGDDGVLGGWLLRRQEAVESDEESAKNLGLTGGRSFDRLRDDWALEKQHKMLGDPANLEAIARVFGVVTPLVFDEGRDRTAPFAGVVAPYGPAWFARGADGWVYMTDSVAGPVGLTLPEVFASVRLGGAMPSDEDEWGRVASATMATLLLFEAGILPREELPSVPLPALPPRATPQQWEAWGALRLLFACRWSVYPGCPIAVTKGFFGAWAGLPESTAALAVTRFLEQSIVDLVAVRPGAPGRRGMRLFLPAGASPPAEWQHRFAADIDRAIPQRLALIGRRQKPPAAVKVIAKRRRKMRRAKLAPATRRVKEA